MLKFRKSKNIDVVYIASPHETHYDYIKDALSHDKHVICEKPMVLEKKQAEEVFALAKERNLILFEGIKTAYCPGFHKLLGVACSGRIGVLKNIEACFTKLENPQHRELVDTKYGGSFLELASYVLLPVLKLFGTGYESVRFETIDGDNGLDLFTKTSLRYPNGNLATVTCGLGVKAEGRLLIAGTLGYIVVGAPWWKTSYFEVHYEDPNKVEKYTESYLDFGLRYEISDFLSRLNGGEKDFCLTRGESICLAGLMERFMQEHRGGQA